MSVGLPTKLSRSRPTLRRAGVGRRPAPAVPVERPLSVQLGTLAETHGNGGDAPIADLPFLLLVMESAEAEPFQSTGTRLA